MAINGTKGERRTEHCQVTKGVPHALCFLLHHTARAPHNACPNCTRAHPGASEEEGWGVAEDHLRSTAPMCFQVSAVSNSPLYQWGYCNNFHREIPTVREGFTNKQNFQNTSLDFPFPMNWRGNICGTIPSYLWNKAIFIYRWHRGGEKKKSLKSQVTGKTVQQMWLWIITT